MSTKKDSNPSQDEAKASYEMMRKAFNEVLRLAKIGLRTQTVTNRDDDKSDKEESDRLIKRGMESLEFVNTFLLSLDSQLDSQINELRK